MGRMMSSLENSLLANADIFPQARQGGYFFNRIDQLEPFATNSNQSCV